MYIYIYIYIYICICIYVLSVCLCVFDGSVRSPNLAAVCDRSPWAAFTIISTTQVCYNILTIILSFSHYLLIWHTIM